MEPLLKVTNVSKIYGKSSNAFTALKSISFTIHAGEFVGIMGPSGAGKSTLLNMLATIDMPTEGTIEVSDQQLDKLKESDLATFRRDNLGFIFQDYHLLDSLTVKENILLPLAIAKIPSAEIEQRVQRMVTLFGIEPLLNQYPYQISGGQKQRTAAARALIANPKLVLADEPTGALDSKSATSLLETFSILNEQHDATIMMVTHDSYAASFCQRILFINDGELLHEISRGNKSRKQFFQEILNILSSFGGGVHDTI